MNELQRIKDWYISQCNGEWEHSFGIQIETLDNPGWLVHFDLTETELSERVFESVVRGDSENENDWVHCRVASGKFIGAGGAGNLPELLNVFLKWAGR